MPEDIHDKEFAAMQAAMLHPKVRTEVEQRLAELALMTSQRPRIRKKRKTAGRETREEKGVRFQAGLGKKGIQARLKELTACSGKTGSSKGAKGKKGKKALCGKFAAGVHKKLKVAQTAKSQIIR